MSQIFHDLIDTLLSERQNLNRIWFAGDQSTPPPFSYQVNFPRLELVFSGEYINEIEGPDHVITEVKIMAGDALYIPPNSWNKPNWDTDCSVLSLLFGRHHLGFSLVSKAKGQDTFFDVQKLSIQTRTGHALDNILAALSTLSTEQQQQPMDEYLVLALISYCRSILSVPTFSANTRSENLYQGICIYIQENFHREISREVIARHFNITPNHLSRLFRQQGHMRLNDYITSVRIERAKFMLKKYSFRLNEVAIRCGFQDVNYFYRVFKNKTGSTPSEYRNLV